MPAAASLITFASGDGTATTSTGSGNIHIIDPHPVWDVISGVPWVSDTAGTGISGGIVLPNTTVPGTPTMIFTQTFNLPGTNNTGWLTVGADDTAGVWLNNVLLQGPNPIQDNACADGPIACEPGEFITFVLGNSDYNQGLNTLQIDVYQIGSVTSGATWASEVNSVPEPSTYALVGLGLVALAFIRRRRDPSKLRS